MIRCKWLAVLFLAVITVTGCTGVRTQVEEVTPTPVPTAVVPSQPVYQVQRGEVTKVIEFSGRIAPVIEQELFFRTAGYVGKVYVKREDWVKQGDVLAELEVTDLKNQLAQAQADLQSIQLNTSRAISDTEANLLIAELNLAQAQAQNPDPGVAIAEVSLQFAQQALADAQKAYKDALDRPWEPQEVRDSYARGLHNAELNLEVVQAQYQQALDGRDAHYYSVQILEQQVEMARRALEQLQAGADLQIAQLAVQRLEGQLADARLTAPFDGQVTSLSIAEGRSIEGYKTVAVVADPSELEVVAELTADEMKDLQESMPVTVTLFSRPGEPMLGSISRLPYPYGTGGSSATAEDVDTRTHITLDMTAVQEDLGMGDTVRVNVMLERKADVLWLPPQAIRLFEGRRFVVVQEADGSQKRVDIKIGLETDDRVEIVEGLTEGQTVIGR